MSRSLKKSPFIPDFLLKRVAALNASGRKSVIKLWKRASVIHPDFVGHTFGVHNGKDHIPVFVTEDMVGHRMGEFSPTRKFIKHAGKV